MPILGRGGRAMDKIAKLFSVRGRAARLTYWKTSLLALLILAVGWCCGLLLAVLSGVGALSAIAIVGVVLAVPISLAVAIRRLHDRNKSAWWLLIFSVLPAGVQLIAGSLRNTQDPSLSLSSSRSRSSNSGCPSGRWWSWAFSGARRVPTGSALIRAHLRRQRPSQRPLSSERDHDRLVRTKRYDARDRLPLAIPTRRQHDLTGLGRRRLVTRRRA